MAHFIDDSDFTSTLKTKIKKVQYDPEPTLETFYNPIKPNLRRNRRVQEEQVPISQIVDKDTAIGKAEAAVLKDVKAEDKKAKDERRKEEERQQNFFYRMFSEMPSRRNIKNQVGLLNAFASGDLAGIASSISSITDESFKTSKKKTVEKNAKITKELNHLKKSLENLKKKRNKKKKATKTGHKGQNDKTPIEVEI